MTKTAKNNSVHLADLDPDYVLFKSLPKDVQYKLQVSTPKEICELFAVQDTANKKYIEGWTPVEKEAVTKGFEVCSACNGSGYFSQVWKGLNQWEGKNIKVFKSEFEACACQVWKHTWRMAKREIPAMYHYVNLWTLQPHISSRLPLEVQAQELEYLKKYRNESFLFHGSSGVGKTTFSTALLRHAFDRKGNRGHFWDPLKHGLEYTQDRWIWRSNFNTLLRQHNEKAKEQWDNPVESPDVTPQKIRVARESGRRPVLVIEEVDKVDFNTHRINFLFSLIDEILNQDGQLIMTTNLTRSEFSKNFTSGDLASTGETLLRRLTDTIHIRDYFKYTPKS